MLLACPFFVPMKRADGEWPHPARLPLGSGWNGQCAANNLTRIPNEVELRDHCNLGYAKCEHIPAEREADAVRFVVASAKNGKIVVRYACERAHRPADCGTLEFDRHQMHWTTGHREARVQRMAECFVEAYFAHRKKT
jgi:hypothetical protein